MPEQTELVTKSAKVFHKEAVEAKRLPQGFTKPEDGDWVCMSAEVPPEDESAGDVVRIAGLSWARHSEKSPIKLLGQHLRGTGDGSPAIIGRMEEFKTGKTKWKDKQVPALFGRFSWAKDGDGKITELAAKYKALWDGGYLDSVSIGFRPIKSRSLNAEKPWDGYEFLESELVELSIVTIPANPAATVLRTIADTFSKEDGPSSQKQINTEDESNDLAKQVSEALAPTLKRMKSLLDDIECAIAVAQPKEAEQASDQGDPRAHSDIDPDAVLSYLKSRL